jgi:hypothetical protein
VVWLYIETFLVLCLANTFEYGYKVNKRKRNEICKKIRLINIGLAIVKRYLVSIYRLCRRSSLVARSRMRQAVPMDVSSDRDSKPQSAADRIILGLSLHHRLVEDRFTRSLNMRMHVVSGKPRKAERYDAA